MRRAREIWMVLVLVGAVDCSDNDNNDRQGEFDDRFGPAVEDETDADGCSSDKDCKDERICENRVCVWPPGALGDRVTGGVGGPGGFGGEGIGGTGGISGVEGSGGAGGTSGTEGVGGDGGTDGTGGAGGPVETGGLGGIGGTGGINGDDAGIDDPPCSPRCPTLNWVEIPGGVFQMGSPNGVGQNHEHPQHEVTVPSFKITKTEVTISQYRRCMLEGVCSEPTSMPGSSWYSPDRENHPVTAVTWHQAREFSEWMGGRLPSEAEWEYAARGGGQDIAYPWGNDEASCDYAVIFDSENEAAGCGDKTTMQVCSKPLGNTAQGLCDMAGNVQEWVEDDYHNSYENAPADGQAWVDSPRSDKRVFRSGSFGRLPDFCRSAFRYPNSPDYFYIELGFRVARD